MSKKEVTVEDVLIYEYEALEEWREQTILFLMAFSVVAKKAAKLDLFVDGREQVLRKLLADIVQPLVKDDKMAVGLIAFTRVLDSVVTGCVYGRGFEKKGSE